MILIAGMGLTDYPFIINNPMDLGKVNINLRDQAGNTALYYGIYLSRIIFYSNIINF